MFKPALLVVGLLASGSSIFPSMPFVAASSAAVEDENGEEAQSHLRTLSSGVSRKLSHTCDGTQSVTTQDPEGLGLPCMEEVPGAQNYGCTANDVRIAGVDVLEVRDAETNEVIPKIGDDFLCDQGQEIVVDFFATVLNGAKSERFDSAVFWSTSAEGDALTGNDCAYSSFTAVGDPGNLDPPDGLPNLEDLDEDDNCGDMPGQTTDTADICGLKITCQDPSGVGDGVTVASCTTYKIPGANDICNNTEAESFLPGSPSKCKCEFTPFPILIRTPSPSESPSSEPSASPSESPSESPSSEPSASPSESPSESPSSEPSASPSESPSDSPSESPSESPSGSPSCPPATFTCTPLLDPVSCQGGMIPEPVQPAVTDSCDTEVTFACCAGVDTNGNPIITHTWTVKNTVESGGGQEEDICVQTIPITCVGETPFP